MADPFLWVQPGGAWYIFFETKSNTNMQGGVRPAQGIAFRVKEPLSCAGTQDTIHLAARAGNLLCAAVVQQTGPRVRQWQPALMHACTEANFLPAGPGDIGVAASTDGGATWTYLGLALDEPFHVSYPFVFEWNGQASWGGQAGGKHRGGVG